MRQKQEESYRTPCPACGRCAVGVRWRIRIRSDSPSRSYGHARSPRLSFRPEAALLSSRAYVAPLSSRAQPRDLAANRRCATSAGRCLDYASLRSTRQRERTHPSGCAPQGHGIRRGSGADRGILSARQVGDPPSNPQPGCGRHALANSDSFRLAILFSWSQGSPRLSFRPEAAPLSSRAQPRDLAANRRCATSAGRCLDYASLRSTRQRERTHPSGCAPQGHGIRRGSGADRDMLSASWAGDPGLQPPARPWPG